MRLLGNIVWFVFGGFFSWLGWIISGLLCCITIVGIPLGLQCFKLAEISLTPFGKEIEFGGGAVSLLANIIWVVCCGIEMAIANVCIGLCWCVTIVGIPFGIQFFKIAKLSLMPFGASVVRVD